MNVKDLKKKEFNFEKDWVYYSGPVWDESEPKQAIKAFLTGKWLVAGDHCDKFEKAFDFKPTPYAEGIKEIVKADYQK